MTAKRFQTVEGKLKYIRTTAAALTDPQARMEIVNDLEIVLASLERRNVQEDIKTLKQVLIDARARIPIEHAGATAQASQLDRLQSASQFLDAITASNTNVQEQFELFDL